MPTTVEFYKVTFEQEPEVDASGKKTTIKDLFEGLTVKTHTFQDEYDRDFYKFKKVDDRYIGGIFRKVRVGEPIKVGKTGTDGWDVSMAEDEGKFETNHLVYFPAKDIVAYIRNFHGNHYTRLAKCLSIAFGVKVELSPLLTRGSIETLLSNRQVVKLKANIPIKPELVSDYGSNWSGQVMDALSKSGGDTVKVETNISLRAKTFDSINNPITAIKDFLEFGATSAKVQVVDVDGEPDWIDLIADKIEYTFEKYHYSKEVLADDSVYDKIVQAYLGKLDEINEAY